MGSTYGGIPGMTELDGDVCAEDDLEPLQEQTKTLNLLQPYLMNSRIIFFNAHMEDEARP
jgi:hypothetical protein